MTFRPTLEQIEEIMMDGSYIGFCRNCGAEKDCCEPDARNYECEECGENEVFGAEEFLIMGQVD